MHPLLTLPLPKGGLGETSRAKQSLLGVGHWLADKDILCWLKQGECRARTAHTVQTFVCGNYLNPSFGLFSPVGCSITNFFAPLVDGCGIFELPPIFTHFHPFLAILAHFTRFCCTFFVIGGCWIMMIGNHRTSSAGELLHTPKRIPTFMVIALLPEGGNFGKCEIRNGEMWHSKIVPHFAVVFKD